MDDPLPTLQTQVMGTAAVLESCRRHGVRCVVLASTSACYGAAPLPHVESRREAHSARQSSRAWRQLLMTLIGPVWRLQGLGEGPHVVTVV
eukprot:COSAG01_NODE_5511_length_4210_cov_69.237898_2_plen_91_part_00